MRYGAFHLKDHIGPDDIYVSTMYDGSDRPEGPFETCIFRMPGHDDLPEFHWRTQEMAESAHRKFVWLIARSLSGTSGGIVTGPVDDSQFVNFGGCIVWPTVEEMRNIERVRIAIQEGKIRGFAGSDDGRGEF